MTKLEIVRQNKEDVRINFLRDYYTREYKEADKKDNGPKIPYFMRAEAKVNEIRRAGMVNQEFERLAK